jgi:PAS domain S-box-containing protein
VLENPQFLVLPDAMPAPVAGDELTMFGPNHRKMPSRIPGKKARGPFALAAYKNVFRQLEQARSELPRIQKQLPKHCKMPSRIPGRKARGPLALAAYKNVFKQLEQARSELRRTHKQLFHTRDLLRDETVKWRTNARIQRERDSHNDAVEDAAEMGTFVWNLRTKVITSSGGFRNILQLPQVRLLSCDSFLESIRSTDRRKLERALNKLNGPKRKTVNMDLRLRRLGGHARTLRLQGRILWSASNQLFVGLVRDVTNSPVLAKATAQLSAVLGATEDAVIRMNVTGRITAWNVAAEKMFGFESNQIIGKHISLLIPQECRSAETRRRKDVMKGQVLGPLETIQVRKDRQLIKVSVSLWPICNQDQTVVEIGALIRDITRSKQLEHDVLHASDREQKRLAADLHDGLGQHLVGTSYLCARLIARLEARALPEAAEASHLGELLRQATNETRELLRGANPIDGENNGLKVSLAALASNATSLFSVDCRFFTSEAAVMRDTFVVNHLYRIAQEAVHNAIKHGHASWIGIVLKRQSGHLVLEILNNGDPYVEKPLASRGMGVGIMRYRAHAVKGTLIIKNNPEGVLVQCSICC